MGKKPKQCRPVLIATNGTDNRNNENKKQSMMNFVFGWPNMFYLINLLRLVLLLLGASVHADAHPIRLAVFAER